MEFTMTEVAGQRLHPARAGVISRSTMLALLLAIVLASAFTGPVGQAQAADNVWACSVRRAIHGTVS
jgi:hypothetical protein